MNDDKTPASEGPGTNERYWSEMFERYERVRPKVPCLDDLFQLGQRDPLVRAFLKSWTTGQLTFEQMVVSLVAELAERCRRYSDHEIKRLRFKDAYGLDPFIVPTELGRSDADVGGEG